jgi:GNAT superfamily N-acetyltransferase
MTEFEQELRPPTNDEEWRAFHEIRRQVLFVNRGKFETYIENHPDDSKPGNYPLILLYRGEIIGVVRIDISEAVAWLRRVAIREDLQHLGHGRVLLRLAESFAIKKGCAEMRTNSALEAHGFYKRCDYALDDSRDSPVNSVPLVKRLR